MAELKTTRTDADVQEFLAGVPDERRREDGRALCELMTDITGEAPVMWGPTMVGFGSYRYRYKTGHTGETMAVGFSPRQKALTLYIMGGFEEQAELMAELGTYTTGKSCLYVKKLADVDTKVLKKLIARSFKDFHGKTVTS